MCHGVKFKSNSDVVNNLMDVSKVVIQLDANDYLMRFLFQSLVVYFIAI